MFLVLLGGFALVITSSQRDARQALTDRFTARTSLTASFVHSYVRDIANRERRQAERLLSGPSVDRAQFEQVVHAMDYDAAVLLDARGRLLQVWPRKPALLGTAIAGKYPHLRRAVIEGKVGVSVLVPAAANHLPITAVAVPYRTGTGRRVLSGASSPASSPLGAYFASAVTTSGGNAILIDSRNHVLASGHHDPVTAGVRPDVHNGVDQVDARGVRLATAVAQVSGTPWRVVLTVPSAKFYAPVSRGRWAPWSLLGAFAGAGLIAVLLFVRLNRARVAAAATARTDLLTSLPNRRAMEEMLAKAVSYATRHEVPLVALMVDLDHFKAINDTHGHQGGDVVLRAAANRARAAVRSEDVVGRWGGEEFLVLLPHTRVRGGLQVAERLRAAIAGGEGSDAGAVTASIGLASLVYGSDALLRDADAALYEAKAAGRNCTVVAATARNNAVPDLFAVTDQRPPPEASRCVFDIAPDTLGQGAVVGGPATVEPTHLRPADAGQTTLPRIG